MTDQCEKYHVFPCDVCGADNPAEIQCAGEYTGGQPLHVCKECGFVYVRTRRSATAIADEWSNEIFGDHNYTARIPAIKARQIFVSEMIDTTVGLRGKSLCDIGAGEGQFLEIVRGADYGADVYAIEPSSSLCENLTKRSIENFAGTVEQYLSSPDAKVSGFDLVSVMWTLENCQDAQVMLKAAHDILKPDGHIIVATGSRIMVPFKKPLNYYLADTPADTHSFRFSANTLRGALARSGFVVEHENRYMDHDVLCMIARKAKDGEDVSWEKDNYLAVLDFFERWHIETQNHYPVGLASKKDLKPSV